ncbi:MAG: Zinc finger, DksA/TraR C4-type [Pseudonocardiales bacterium]|nr:Zinc finger, DksA/TraR C4-type [Pseudonocardiales bacterium]
MGLERNISEVMAASLESNADDEHDPEGATIAFEREQLGALLTGAREQLSEIDDAIARIEGGIYGRCVECGAVIKPERLEARPSAARCIACASIR